MLLSLRKNGLTSLFKEFRVFKGVGVVVDMAQIRRKDAQESFFCLLDCIYVNIAIINQRTPWGGGKKRVHA